MKMSPVTIRRKLILILMAIFLLQKDFGVRAKTSGCLSSRPDDFEKLFSPENYDNMEYIKEAMIDLGRSLISVLNSKKNTKYCRKLAHSKTSYRTMSSFWTKKIKMIWRDENSKICNESYYDDIIRRSKKMISEFVNNYDEIVSKFDLRKQKEALVAIRTASQRLFNADVDEQGLTDLIDTELRQKYTPNIPIGAEMWEVDKLIENEEQGLEEEIREDEPLLDEKQVDY